MLETLMKGLMVGQMMNATNQQNDMERFKEILGGSPLTAIEETALLALIGEVGGGEGLMKMLGL